MSLGKLLENLKVNGPHLRQTAERGNLGVIKSMLGPAWRGLVKQAAKGHDSSTLGVTHDVHFDWQYQRDQPEICTWHRRSDVQPPRSTPDAGTMVFENADRVILDRLALGPDRRRGAGELDLHL